MSYSVPWECIYNRPTVGGKVQNPDTGEIEDATKTTWSGPPAVDVIWFNIHGESNFKIVRTAYHATVDQVYLEVANHIRDKLYTIVSLSASAYSFHITCLTDKSMAEMHELFAPMRRNLARPPRASCSNPSKSEAEGA
jgi:hypothetical protein